MANVNEPAPDQPSNNNGITERDESERQEEEEGTPPRPSIEFPQRPSTAAQLLLHEKEEKLDFPSQSAIADPTRMDEDEPPKKEEKAPSDAQVSKDQLIKARERKASSGYMRYLRDSYVNEDEEEQGLDNTSAGSNYVNEPAYDPQNADPPLDPASAASSNQNNDNPTTGEKQGVASYMRYLRDSYVNEAEEVAAGPVLQSDHHWSPLLLEGIQPMPPTSSEQQDSQPGAFTGTAESEQQRLEKIRASLVGRTGAYEPDEEQPDLAPPPEEALEISARAHSADLTASRTGLAEAMPVDEEDDVLTVGDIEAQPVDLERKLAKERKQKRNFALVLWLFFVWR